jgi:hypothetical protein
MYLNYRKLSIAFVWAVLVNVVLSSCGGGGKEGEIKQGQAGLTLDGKPVKELVAIIPDAGLSYKNFISFSHLNNAPKSS